MAAEETPSDRLEAARLIRQRGRRARRRGETYRALALYESAYRTLGEQPAPNPARRLLHEALDLAEDAFGSASAEAARLANGLDELTRGRDARAHAVLGLASSFAARRSWNAEPASRRWESLALEAKKRFESAVLIHDDPDAWGSLGGVCRRLAFWYELEGNARLAAEYR